MTRYHSEAKLKNDDVSPITSQRSSYGNVNSHKRSNAVDVVVTRVSILKDEVLPDGGGDVKEPKNNSLFVVVGFHAAEELLWISRCQIRDSF